MARTALISKEKRQSIITLRHEGQSIWKISRTLKVSSNAVAKPINRYDEMRTATGKEDPELLLLQS
jgi:transposase-like protein